MLRERYDTLDEVRARVVLGKWAGAIEPSDSFRGGPRSQGIFSVNCYDQHHIALATMLLSVLDNVTLHMIVIGVSILLVRRAPKRTLIACTCGITTVTQICFRCPTLRRMTRIKRLVHVKFSG